MQDQELKKSVMDMKDRFEHSTKDLSMIVNIPDGQVDPAVKKQADTLLCLSTEAIHNYLFLLQGKQDKPLETVKK